MREGRGILWATANERAATVICAARRSAYAALLIPASADPAGLTARARPEARRERCAANLDTQPSNERYPYEVSIIIDYQKVISRGGRHLPVNRVRRSVPTLLLLFGAASAGKYWVLGLATVSVAVIMFLVIIPAVWVIEARSP
jgi:hypothetical protein